MAGQAFTICDSIAIWRLPPPEKAQTIFQADTSIPPARRNHPAHAAHSILHIADVAGYQVDVYVRYRLAGGVVDVDADVETVGLVLVADDCLDFVQELPAGLLVVDGQQEVGGLVDFGDDEGVPLADGVFVENGVG